MEHLYEKASASAAYLKEKLRFAPKIAVVLGSGLGDLTAGFTDTMEIPYAEIPSFPQSTVAGHKGALLEGKLGDTPVLAMEGRFHFYEGYSMKEVCYPFYVFKLLGIETVVLTNAAGGINRSFEPGTLMLITDTINMMGTNPLIGPNDERFGPRFPDMTEIFSHDLLDLARSVADGQGIAYKEVAGTFAYMTGKGQSAERAATLMENAFSVMGRVDVRKKLSEAGVDIFDDTGKIRSIVDIFSDLEKVLGGMTDEQKSSVLEQFGLVDKEAKSAFSVLISDIGKLEASMHDVVNATGETDAALEFSRNSMQQATEVWNQFKNIGLQVGEILLPAISAGLTVAGTALSGVSAVIETVTGFFGGWLTLLQEGNPVIVGLTTTLGILTAALAANYAWTQRAVVIGGIKKVLDIAQAAATTGLTAAQWALNAAFYASPLGWVALAIGAVIAAVTYCWQKFEGFRRVILGVWEVVKEFGKTLLESVVKPFKQVLSGIGGVCSAIVSLLKGNFKEAATLAKEGFKDIGEGVLGANPASVITNTVRNGNYAEAWERGKQAGSDSWAASQQAEDTNAANRLMPELPEAVTVPAVQTPDFGALMTKLEGGGKTGTKSRNSVLRLDDEPIVPDLNETAQYTAITRKLEPVAVPVEPRAESVPANVQAAVTASEKVQPSLTQVNDVTQEYDGGETDYLADIMQNVRKIAAVMALPLAVSLAPANADAGNGHPLDLNVPAVETAVPEVPVPNISDAYNVENIRETNNTFTADNSRTYNDSGRSIQVGKVCDEVVIHVANTSGKDADTIRSEIMNILNELGEG